MPTSIREHTGVGRLQYIPDRRGVTVGDGFRFGFGFILAHLVFAIFAAVAMFMLGVGVQSLLSQ